MRVVFSPGAYWPAIGGSEAYSRGLAEQMASHGIDTHVIAADAASNVAFYEVDVEGIATGTTRLGDVTVHRLPLVSKRDYSRLRRDTPEMILARRRQRFSRAYRRKMKRLKPDVVVALPHLLPNVEEAVELRDSSNWPLIYAPHLHEEDPWWPADQVAEAVQASDAIIALTSHEKNRLVESYGAYLEQVVVIPPAVVAPQEVASGLRPPVVLFVGRRTASKRIDTLWEAMKIVWQSMPEARLVVAGPPSSASAEFERAAAHDPRMRVLPAVSDKERAELIGSARVMASASVIEAFGITTLEAWAHSTPVVVADTGVSRSIVRHGVDGLLADRSPEGMAEQLLVLLGDPDLAASMGDVGRKRVISEFTWERSGYALLDLIDSLQ